MASFIRVPDSNGHTCYINCSAIQTARLDPHTGRLTIHLSPSEGSVLLHILLDGDEAKRAVRILESLCVTGEE